MTVLAYTDGAARGNPGESGIGVIFKDEHGTTLAKLYGYIGESDEQSSQNTRRSLACLKSAAKTKCSRLVVHSDSELMVRQLKGEYKVKDPNLKAMYLKSPSHRWRRHHSSSRSSTSVEI